MKTTFFAVFILLVAGSSTFAPAQPPPRETVFDENKITPETYKYCLEPTLAKKNLNLFEAIDKNDLDRVKKAISDGADPNCPFPRLNSALEYWIEFHHDVPLYRATNSALSPQIFWTLIRAGAKVRANVPGQQDISRSAQIADAYFPFYVSHGTANDLEKKKVTKIIPPPPSPPVDYTPYEAKLTPDEIAKFTLDPTVAATSTDPWVVLSAQAPLRSFVIGGEHLRGVLKNAPDKGTWENYRAPAIRQGILKGAQLDPLPPKLPLNPLMHNLRNRDGYSVQNVAFEASEGFFVTGNLFIPTTGKGPYPAILISHGHFGKWGGNARTLPENQILATRLAQMGAVVFTYDMVGWGDSTQLNHPDAYGFWGFGDQDHFNDGTGNNLLALELWDGIRSLDFLESLQDNNQKPLVDRNRVGVTGASGGATHSLYLAAVDDRVKAAALVVMITAGYTGDDYCEDGMKVHDVPNQNKTNNVEIAATLAPKPLLIISDGDDWTQWFNSKEYPYIKRIWGFYGEPNKALNFHFRHEGHDYRSTKRARAYDFFSTAFGLQKLPNTGTGIDDNFEGVTLEATDSLTVFNSDYPRPPYGMNHILYR